MRMTLLNMIHFVAIYLYHIVGKFGKVFNLAIWQSRRKLPNLIPPILNPVAPASL